MNRENETETLIFTTYVVLTAGVGAAADGPLFAPVQVHTSLCLLIWLLVPWPLPRMSIERILSHIHLLYMHLFT